MGMRLTVDARGFLELNRELGRIKSRSRDLQPVLRPRAELLRTVIDDSFRDSMGPNGEVWDALSESTLNRRRQTSPKPLVKTGQMRRSIVVRSERSAIVFGVAGAAATYAPAHQFGTVDIPARPFLPMDEDGNALFASGKARDWAEATADRVSRYVMRGER